MDTTDDQLQAFAAALTGALAASGRSRGDLAAAVSAGRDSEYSVSTVSLWLGARAEPPRSVVFALEAELGLAPGALSSLLGYLPLDDEVGARAAIVADPNLDALSRRVLLAVLDALGG